MTEERFLSLLEGAVASHRAGDTRRAIDACQAALRERPDEPEALHLSATLHASAGEIPRALAFARRACALCPGVTRYMYTLGRLHNAAGEAQEAEAVFRAIIDRDASFAGAWQGLAAALKMRSRDRAALRVLKRGAARLREPVLLREYARELLAQGRKEDAARQLEIALSVAPDDLVALNNLGSLRLQQGRTAEAVACLESALRLRADDPEALANLGLAYRSSGRLSQALACFDSLGGTRALSAGQRASRASILLAMGRRQEALQGFEDALRIETSQPQALAGKAELLEWEGRYQEGFDLLSAHLAGEGADTLIVLAAARLLRRLDRPAEAIALLEPLVQRGISDAALRRAAGFTLGDLYDQSENYPRAFAHYAAAHGFGTKRFDMHAHRAWVGQMIEMYSAERLAGLPLAGPTQPHPVFIIGMPRSGTSLVEQILGSHPLVHAGGEREHIGMLARQLLPRLSGDRTGYPAREALTALAEGYLRDAGKLTESTRYVTDKMPLNFLYLGLISQLFPSARVVHCRRSPVDTALSCYFTDFLDPSLAFSENLPDIAAYHAEYRRLMAHWATVLELPVHEVVYEELVRGQEPVTRALLDALGLPWDERCLRFHESGRSVHTASHAQVRRPIYASSVGRGENYRDFIAPLQGMPAR